MRNVRRFLVATLVPALILAIFAVGAVAANGSSGKVELCHWTGQKFVEIRVSLNAKPAHLGHGDVEPDQYGDCAGDDEGDDEGDDRDHDGDHEGRGGDSDDHDGDHEGRGGDSDDHDGGKANEGGNHGGGDDGDEDD